MSKAAAKNTMGGDEPRIEEAEMKLEPRDRHAIWISTFGAFVALQVQERIQSGRGPPEEVDMDRFVEEAEAVADMARDSQLRLDEK